MIACNVPLVLRFCSGVYSSKNPEKMYLTVLNIDNNNNNNNNNNF